jgi:hypothetical protein
MHKKVMLLLAVVFFTTVRSQAHTNDNKAVAAAVEALRIAMIDPDSTVLNYLVSDKLSYGHSNGVVQDKATFISSLMSGKSDFVTIDLTRQTISISGNVAVVRHDLSATTNDGGHPGIVKLTILLIWKKSHHHWQLLARQAVRAS